MNQDPFKEYIKQREPEKKGMEKENIALNSRAGSKKGVI